MALLSQLIDDESEISFTKKVDVLSPISGRVLPLDEMPDPLFAERLFGEGCAIAPSGYQVLAPFVAKVQELSPMGNQIQLRSKSGLIMQIELGVGSHKTHGEGFKRMVKAGQTVQKGSSILTFDLAKMKQLLTSPLCAVTLLNSKKLKAIKLNQKQVVAGEDIAMSLYI